MVTRRSVTTVESYVVISADDYAREEQTRRDLEQGERKPLFRAYGRYV